MKVVEPLLNVDIENHATGLLQQYMGMLYSLALRIYATCTLIGLAVPVRLTENERLAKEANLSQFKGMTA
jgi:hypothetical protein